MYKKICLLGDKNQFIPFDYSQKADIALQSMGLNSGNNVFGFALQKMTLTKTQCVDMVSLSHFFNFTAEINENEKNEGSEITRIDNRAIQPEEIPEIDMDDGEE